MSEEGANASGAGEAERDTLAVLVPLTLAYALIFVAGIVGNVSTCVVIARNRSMHTATNYYLFSLAISDLLLLVSGLPADARAIWYPDVYALGETMCVALGLSSETAANATVLTITAFTVERYIAICHPFISHTMSKLSRVIKFIFGIWILALCTAIPQAIQYGVIYTENDNKPPSSVCTVKWITVEHAFEISGFLFFVGPMTVITVLYILIGIKLRTSRVLHPTKQVSIDANGRNRGSGRGYKNSASQRRVIRMLVAVALSFFVCWAPFHAQRLLAVYGKTVERPSATFFMVYRVLTYISGVLYFLSTAINPVLYNIMSNKFREAFKTTLAQCCRRGEPASGLSRTYSALAASRVRRPSSAPRTAPRRPPLLPADSLESARSISNSSLRDLDEEEFSGAELAVYMGQLNRNMGRIKRVEPI